MSRELLVFTAPFRHGLWAFLTQLLLVSICTSVLSAASPSLALQVSNETAPAGSFAQFKISLTSPALVESGALSMDFDPTVFGNIVNVAVFSATGDAIGYANVSEQHVDAHFSSATAAIGQLPNLPVFVVSIPVLPGLAAGKTTAVTVNPSGSPWNNASGAAYSVTANAGSFTVGQSVAVQNVTPGGGVIPTGRVLQINGAGFDPDTTASIDDVSISSTQYISPEQLAVTLGAQTEMTGKHVRVTGSSGTAVNFYPSLPSASGDLPAGLTGLPGVQPLVPLAAYTTANVYNNLIGQGDITDFLALLNPNSTPVTVALQGVNLGSLPAPVINRTLIIPAGTLFYFNATNLIDAAGERQLWIMASAPVRILEYADSVPGFPSGSFITVSPPNTPTSAPPPIETVVAGGPVSWSWEIGTTQPSAENLSVAGNLSFSVSVSGSAAPFLAVTPQQGTASAFLTVAPNLALATPGTYTATITVTPTLPSALSSLITQPASIPVTLVVSASPLIVVSGSNCCAFGEPVLNMPATGPDSITLTSNGTPAAFTVNVGSCDGGNWLSVTPNGGVTPATLTLTANPVGLNLPGGGHLYLCPVTIQGPANALTLTAGLTVFGAPTPPSSAAPVQATPGEAIFQFPFSGAAPSPQTVMVQANGNPVTATVQTESGGNWLGAVVTAGDVNSILTIGVSAGLAIGAYTGSVTLSSPGLLSVTLPVYVTVLGLPPNAVPLTVTPSPISVIGPAGLTQSAEFSVAAPGGIPVAFTISVSTSNGGNWLSLESALVTPTELYGQLSAAGLLPGVYQGSINIVWGNGSLVVPVTFTVTASLASPPTSAAILNAASEAPSAITPGEVITLFGSGLGAAASGLTIAPNGTVSTTLGGAQVLINGVAAPLIYVSPSQVNAIIPYEVGSGIANIQVNWNGAQSAAWGIPIASSSPAIFTTASDGVGQAAVLNQDNSVNGASNPAARGTVVQIYATGGGQTSPAASTGSVTKVAAQLALPVTVTIGGVSAQVLYAGSAPGEVEGVVQLNVVVPASVTPGAALPLLVTIGGVASQAGVTLAVQ